MLQHFGGSGGDDGIEKHQMHGDIRIHMIHFHENIAHGKGDVQFFPAFPDQGGFFGLAGLYLAADEFPEKAPALWAGR